MTFFDSVSIEWRQIFRSILSREQARQINKILSNRALFYPNDVFKAFRMTPYHQIKVVILGTDPYPNHHATGLAFDTSDRLHLPASLKAIAKELKMEYPENSEPPDLERWAQQGVLLLNASLTIAYDSTMRSQHRRQWRDFTAGLLNYISVQCPGTVFMLWGNVARSFINAIHAEENLILTCGHPSPQNRNRASWFGNDHFKLANEFLKQHKQLEIRW